MMTQPHFSNDTYSPVYGIHSVFHEAIPASAGNGTICQCALMPETNRKASLENDGPAQTIEEMPLWPSLDNIRPAMETDAPLKKDTKKALWWRSLAIGTTLVSMAALGVMMF